MKNIEINTKYNNLLQVSEYFKNEEICKEHLAKLRWNGNVTCPQCTYDKVYETKAGFKCANPKCYKKFTVTVGTFFENTKISLRKWFIAIYIMSSHKKGISSLQLSKDIAVTQKTAWYMLHRIRQTLSDKGSQMQKGVVEVDERYIGGAHINKQRYKRSGHMGSVSKVAVIRLVERKGNLMSIPISNTRKVMLDIIVQ